MLSNRDDGVEIFHAKFEAAEGLSQRARNMSGVGKVGTRLVDTALSSDKPLPAATSR